MNKLRFFCGGALACAAAFLINAAPAPAPEQLLPADTIGFLSVPDWSRHAQGYDSSAFVQLWADPSMKPFRDKFEAGFKKDIIEPLEKELGVKFKDYQELLQGQLTLAILPGQEKGKTSWTLLLDSKDKQAQLSTRLAELKKRWTDSGKQLKTEKVRDVEFTTVTFTSDDLQGVFKKAFPQAAPEENKEAEEEEKAEPTKQTITLGQSGSLLLVGDTAQTLEKILSRLAGGLVDPLSEQSAYQKDAAALRNALVVGWFNWKPIYDRVLEEMTPDEDSDEPMLFNPQQAINAVGLGGINSIAFAGRYGAEGLTMDLSIAAPEAQRKGLLKLLAPEPQDASPPPIVAADALKFQRWRLNLPQAWDQLEATVRSVSPQAAGVLSLVLGTLGKDKDPNFDFRKNLIGNLGNDIITVQKPPRAATAEALVAPPSLFLLGSPKPDDLASALTSLGSVMAPPESGNSPFKEREFLGKKIYSLTTPNPQDPSVTQTLSYSTSGGYVVFSTDTAALEEHLRSAEKPGKALRELPGFREAAEKVGGMNSGVFGFENQAESARHFFQVAKKDPNAIDQLFFARLGAGEDGADNKMKSWLDFSLLPNFELVEKYFGISVYSFSAKPEGFLFRAHGPRPPTLAK